MRTVALTQRLNDLASLCVARLHSGSQGVAPHWGSPRNRHGGGSFGRNLVEIDRAGDKYLLLPQAESGHGRTCRIAPFAMAHDADSGRWWPSGWAHGLLRVGQDPRPRNS